MKKKWYLPCRQRHGLRKALMIMKLTMSMLLIAVMSFASEGYSQSARLNLKMENATMVEIFQEIERISEFGFLFKNDQIDLNRKYSINLEDVKIDEVLNQVLSEDYSYRILGKNIIITRENLITGNQKINVTGKVLDKEGQPLPGVTVIIKGTTNGTITNFDGEYSLKDVVANAIIQFSFVGMKMQEISIEGKSVINVILEEDAIGIEEVVAVGYGTMRKSDLTGAVSSVKVDDMNKVVKTSVDQALQGLAAGVLVTQNSAQPGGGISIRIRGVTSLSAGNEPLYVIDGIPIESTENSSGANFGPGLSPLASLNPDDIENIEILKDASSTAIYGARGSNGVVLITTKQGKVGDGKVVFSSSIGFQNVSNNADLLNAQEYMDVYNTALINDAGGDESNASQNPEYFTQAERDSIGDGTNWLDKILQTGTIQNYQLSASGGKNNLTYFLSVGHTSNEGIIKNSDFKRTSIRINLKNQFTKRLTVGGNLSASEITSNFIRTEGERQNSGVSSVMYSAMRYRPTRSMYSSIEGDDGEYYTEAQVSNPLALVEKMTNATTRVGLIGNAFIEYKLLEGLKFKSMGAFNYNFVRDNFYAPQEGTYLGAMSGGIARLGFSHTRNFTNTNTLNYRKKTGKHVFNALGVFEYIHGDLYRVKDEVTGFVNDILRENDLSSGSNASNPQNYTQDYSLLSYLTRINYNYANKYLFAVSGRYDGSSRFGGNNKYAFFPSASFGWNISNEDFLKDVDFLSQLKLRVSYGIAGNQNIALYSSTSPLVSNSYILGSNVVTGFQSSRIANPDLKWEKKEQTNVGLDFGFLRGKISGSFEYYNDITNDLLLAKKLPTSTGFTNVVSNIGSIRNRGLEISLNTVNVDKKLKWKTNFNIAFPSTIVRNLGEDEFMLAGYVTSMVKNTQIVQVGEPLGQFYGYINDGIAQTEEEVAYTLGNTGIGDYKFKDISGPDGVPDGIISAAYDRTVIGNALPDFFGGITNTFSYKGFEFSFFLQGTFGNDIMNLNNLFMGTSKPGSNLFRSVLDAWTPENSDSQVRKLSFLFANVDANTNFIEDGSYLRLKNVSLSYNLPRSIVSSIGLSNVQINIAGQNLFVLTKYSGMDPEVDAGRNNSLTFGHDYFGYPQSKIITTEISVTF